MKILFALAVLIPLLCPLQASAQQDEGSLVEVIPNLVVDRMFNKVNDHEFCTRAKTLWARAQKEGKTREPWMPPFIGMMKKSKCDHSQSTST